MIRLRGEGPGWPALTRGAAGEDLHSVASEDHPVAIHGDADGPAPGEHWNPESSVLWSFSPQYGPRQQWAEPVTGSSGTPSAGAKNRETKSTSGRSETAVTMMPRAGMAARAFMSGSRSHTSEAVASSTSRSNRFRPTKTGVAPSAWSSPGTAGPPPPTALQGNQGISIPRPAGRSASRTVFKGYNRRRLLAAGLPENKRRGKRRVAAEVHLLLPG